MNMSARRARLTLLFVLSCFAATGVFAAPTDLKLLLDSDNSLSTGCRVITSLGNVDGIDAIYTTTYDVGGDGNLVVTGVTQQTCATMGTVNFTAPVQINPGGWAVGRKANGTLVVETRVPASAIPGGIRSNMRWVFLGVTGSNLDTIINDADGHKILFPAPMGGHHRIVGVGPPLRTITLDGNDSDWAGLSPLATNLASTGGPSLRFLGGVTGFATQDNLYFYFSVQSNSNAPTANDDGWVVLRGSSINISAPGILSNDFDPNYKPLTAILISGPEHGTLTLNANGSFVYHNDGSNAPNDGFRYKANNGLADSNTARVSFDIVDNRPPVATADAYSVTHGGTLTVPVPGVKGNDFDPDNDPFVSQLVAPPTHGTVALNNDGSFTYTHDGSATVSDQFLYHDLDAYSASNIATVTMTVGPDAPPVAAPDAYSVLEGGTLIVAAPGLFANDSDPDTPQSLWTAVVVTPPLHGTLTMHPGGSFNYVNDSVTGASDSFQYKVHDGILDSNVVTVTITVTPVNDVPFFTVGGPVVVLDTAGAQSIPHETGINAGATDESGQALNFIVSNDNNALFSTQPSISPAGVLTFTPVGTAEGTANVSVTLHDNGGTANGGVDTSAPQSFTIDVDKIPSITSGNNTTFTVGTPGTFNVTTDGKPKPSIAETGALPSGVTFVDGTGPSKGTGVLSGTPGAGTGGVYPITFQATNVHGSSPVQNFTLTIKQAPAITSSNSATFTKGSPGTFTVTTTGFPAPALSETGAVPTGLTFVDNGNGTATLSGTPTVAGGVYSISVTASNGVGSNAGQTLNITINQAPAITSGNSVGFQATVASNFTVTTTGFPTPSLGETGALPTGITFTDNGNGTATLGGNAQQGTGGVYVINITATNVAGSAPQSFTITVCNNIAVTAPGVTSGAAGSPFSQNFTQTGAVGGATFTLNSGSLPTGMSLATNGTLSGTPTQNGSFPITVKVTDGNSCTGVSSTYTLVITCQTITVTNPATNTGVAAAAFSQTFSQSGAIGGATFTTASALPTGLSLSTAGVLSGTPTQTGSFPIVVTVTDGNGCTGTGSTYTLTITCQTITVTKPVTSTGTAGSPFSQTFTQTGAIGTATFTLNSGILPSSVTRPTSSQHFRMTTNAAGLTLSAAGVLSGTPTQTGTFPITVLVTDSNSCTGISSTYNLVIGCQSITVTNPTTTTGTANAPFSQTFTQSSAIGSTSFTLASGTLPAGLSLATNGTLSGTPTQTGNFPITVTVTDGNGCTGTGSTYTLVIGCQTITVTKPVTTTGTVNAPFSQSFTQSGAIGTATFTTASTLPTGLSLSTAGLLSGTPLQQGSFPIVVTVTDSNGCTGNSSTYTLVISCQTITVGNPATTNAPAGTPLSINFTQSGAIGGATFTTASTLPTGLSLATNGTLSGTPMQGGTFPIVVTVTDGNGCTGTNPSYSLQITCPTITVTNPGVSTGTAGTAFSQTFTQSGGIGTITWSETGALPSGISLNSASGVLSGTTSQVGTFPITVTATDQNGCQGTGATYNLTFNCQTVTVTNPVVNTGTVNAAFSQTFTKSGILGTVTWSETGALPAGITLNSATGVLSGTPTVNGSFPITVKATDTNGCFGTSSYTLTINCQTITVTKPVVTTGTVDAPFSQTFTQSGAQGTATFTTASTLPAGLSLSTAGVLSGTPTVKGTFPIVVTVTDSNGCTGSSTTYNLVINCQTITVTNPATTTGTTGVLFSQTFTQSAAHGTATFTTASTLPTGFSLSTAGVLSGTTNQHGSFPIVVTVTDSNTCTGTGATYNLVINCQTITVTNPVPNTGTVGTPFSQSFSQSGAIGGATFTTASTLPTGLSLSTAGVLSGTPVQSGSFPIVVTVTDGNGCTGSGSTYTLVIACNVISVTNPGVSTGTAGVAFDQQFTQTGGNGTITWSETGALPTGITINTSTGHLAGTTSQTGSFPITVTATDSNGCTGTGATYTLVINCQTVTVTNPATTTGTAGVAFDQQFTATGILGTVSWSETGALPSGITLNSATGHLAGTTSQIGSFPITVKATDTNGCFGTSSYTLTIVCQTVSVTNPVTNTATFNTAGFSQTFTASGILGSATFTLASGTLPTGMSLSSGGVLSGTPTQTGTFPITVKATDTNTCNGTGATYTLSVAPVATGDSYSNLVDNTQAVVTGGGTASPGTPFVTLSGAIIGNDLPAGNVTANGGTFATSAGGSVTIASDGTFIYTPKANPGAAATTTDTFTYTVSSNTGGLSPVNSAAATVTLNLAGRVWYVKNNGGGSNGQSQSPFTTLAAAAAASTANDIIFVYNGDGSNSGQNAGITLKNGQQLLGEINGLIVNAQTLVAVGSRPTIGNSAGDGISVPATAGSVTGVFIKGLSVAGTANGINISSSGANTLTATVDNVNVTGATANNGIKVAAASTTTSTVTVQNSVVNAAGQNGIDAQQTSAGNLVLNINNNTITATGTGINVVGTGSTSTTITNFATNTISGNTGGSGITVTTATFDATPGGAFTTVSGGTTAIGPSGNPVGGSGMVLTNVKGDLSFTDLDISNSSGSGLSATGVGTFNAGAGTGFQIAITANAGTVSATGGPAVSLNTVTGNMQMSTITSTSSATTGVALNSFSGTFSAPSGSTITGSPTTAFQVGSSVSGSSISYAGTINTTVGKGVDLTSNTGSTITFTGALTISSGSNTGFNATGGGTVTSSATTSTLTSTTGTALNVVSTTIGAANLKFQSISSNGGSNGIILNTTGATGNLQVLGTGSAGSGGTIQNKTGAEGSPVETATLGVGIYLNSTTNPSLNWMSLHDFSNYAIVGTDVAGFTLTRTTVSGTNGTGANAHGGVGEGDVYFTRLTGSATVDNCTFSGAAYDTFHVFNNTSQTLNRFTMTNSTLGATDIAGNDGLVFQATGGTLNVTVQDTTFTGERGDAFQMDLHGTMTSDLIFGGVGHGNTLTNAMSTANSLGGDINVGGGNVGDNVTFTFNISNNSVNGAIQSAIAVGAGTGTHNFTGTINANTVGTVGVADSGSFGGSAIGWTHSGGSGHSIATITNNQLHQYNNEAVNLTFGGFGPAGGFLTATVTGNTFSDHGTNASQGFLLTAGTAGPPNPMDTGAVCLTLSGNTFSNSFGPGASTDIRIRERFDVKVGLPGYGGPSGAGSGTQVQTFLSGNNSAATASVPDPSLGTTNGTTNGYFGACPAGT